jgi:CRISPR/Cas system-associated endonuclease Cas1
MTDTGRKAFLTAYQEKKREQITHPFLGEKLPWGLGALCAGAAAGTVSARRS